MKKSKTNVWKIVAIIFICLFVLETYLFYSFVNMGIETLRRDNACSELCYDLGDISYSYDTITEFCYCFNEYREITHSRRMG